VSGSPFRLSGPGAIGYVGWGILVLAACLSLVVPFLLSPYVLHLIILVLLYAYLSQCWNIVGGYAGQLSLGHALFFGTGAYTSTLLFLHYSVTPWAGMLIGACCAATLGLAIGFLCFRYGLKGPYFALVTIAFAEMARLVALNVTVLGGASGLQIPLHEGAGAAVFQLSNLSAYYVIYGMTILSVLIVNAMRHNSIGYFLLAIREDELGAEAVGVNPRKYKLVSLVASAFLTALGGTFYAQYYLFLEPNSSLGIGVSITFAVNAIIGGRGTILGPILGSLLLTLSGEFTRSLVTYGGAGVHMMIFGAILMFTCIFLPEGMVPTIAKRLNPKRTC